MKKIINDLKHLVNPVNPACPQGVKNIKKRNEAKYLRFQSEINDCPKNEPKIERSEIPMHIGTKPIFLCGLNVALPVVSLPVLSISKSRTMARKTKRTQFAAFSIKNQRMSKKRTQFFLHNLCNRRNLWFRSLKKQSQIPNEPLHAQDDLTVANISGYDYNAKKCLSLKTDERD